MAVTVTPETFTMVKFDHSEIVALVEGVAADLGLDPSVDIAVEVDQDIPLIAARLESVDPIKIFVEGGAFEDPKRIREFNSPGAKMVVGRLLLQALDRRSDAFGDPPSDDQITIPQVASWTVYSAGRLDRLGYRSQRQRRLYNFRNRHGFQDSSDQIFEELWTGQDLTWTDIVSASDRALGAC